MSQYADPFLSAYMTGSGQGLSLANQIADEELARQEQARLAEQFNRDLDFRQREALIDNKRGDEYLVVNRQNADVNQQRWQAEQVRAATALAEDRAARAFDAQRYRELLGSDMGPPEPGRYVMADPAQDFAAMPGRARQSVLDDMQSQRERARAAAERQMRLEMMQRELQGLAKTKAAMMKSIDDAGGMHIVDDPLVKQLVKPLNDIMLQEAGIQAALMKDQYGVPIDSAMSFQREQMRIAGRGAGGTKSPMDATTIRARVARLRAQNQMYERSMGRVDENGEVPIFMPKTQENEQWPADYVRGLIEDNNLEIQQLLGMDPSAGDGGGGAAPSRMGGDTRTEEELQLDAIERRMSK